MILLVFLAFHVVTSLLLFDESIVEFVEVTAVAVQCEYGCYTHRLLDGTIESRKSSATAATTAE